MEKFYYTQAIDIITAASFNSQSAWQIAVAVAKNNPEEFVKAAEEIGIHRPGEDWEQVEDATILEIIRQSDTKVDAIKQYRIQFDAGLKEAKDKVEIVMKRHHLELPTARTF